MCQIVSLNQKHFGAEKQDIKKRFAKTIRAGKSRIISF